MGIVAGSIGFAPFFLKHQVHYHDCGDFIVDEANVFEIGGACKKEKQLGGNKNGYVVADDIEVGFDNKIPLWLFGFLY